MPISIFRTEVVRLLGVRIICMGVKELALLEIHFVLCYNIAVDLYFPILMRCIRDYYHYAEVSQYKSFFALCSYSDGFNESRGDRIEKIATVAGMGETYFIKERRAYV